MSVTFRIVNVVATAALDRPLDLKSLHKRFPHEVVHDQEIYGGRAAYFRSMDMQGKIIIFPSGKMISVGTRNVTNAKKELTLMAKTLKAHLKTEPKIQNIVATANLGFEADLTNIASSKKIKVIYEPDQFPGAIIHLPLSKSATKASFLVFASGKLVCVGLKNTEDVRIAIEQLLAMLPRPFGS